MNLPTLILTILIGAAALFVIGRGLYSRRHGKGGCSHGCAGCPYSRLCQKEKKEP